MLASVSRLPLLFTLCLREAGSRKMYCQVPVLLLNRREGGRGEANWGMGSGFMLRQDISRKHSCVFHMVDKQDVPCFRGSEAAKSLLELLSLEKAEEKTKQTKKRCFPLVSAPCHARWLQT